MSTHIISNQPPPRVGLDEFATNRPLVEAVEGYDAGWASPTLHEVGRHVGTAQFQQDAELANTVPWSKTRWQIARRSSSHPSSRRRWPP